MAHSKLAVSSDVQMKEPVGYVDFFGGVPISFTTGTFVSERLNEERAFHVLNKTETEAKTKKLVQRGGFG